MEKCFIIILTFFISLVTHGQVSDTTSIADEDILQFFSDIRHSELSAGQTLIIKQPIELKIETVLFYASRNKEVFQSLDTDFFVKQIKAYKNFQWDTTIIGNARIVDQSDIDIIFKNSKEGSGWETFKSLYGKEELYSLSLPVFTPDRNYCIIEINRSCASLCGTYCVIILKLQGNQWKRFKELECDVS